MLNHTMMMNSARNTTYNAKREKGGQGKKPKRTPRVSERKGEAKARERDANYNIKHTYHDQESWEEDLDRPRHAHLLHNTHTNHQNYVSYCSVFKFVFKILYHASKPSNSNSNTNQHNKHKTQVS